MFTLSQLSAVFCSQNITLLLNKTWLTFLCTIKTIFLARAMTGQF